MRCGVVSLVALLLFTVSYHSLARDWTYLIYPDQVAPLQITRPNIPMHSGVVTDIVKAIFKDQNHQLVPVQAPAQRMERLRQQGRFKNWITYGAQSLKSPGSRLSDTALFEWHHVLITRKKVSVTTFPELTSRHLLLVRGYDYPELEDYLVATGGGQGTRIAYVPSPAHALKMLQKGRGEAYLDIDLRVTHHLNALNIDPANYHIQSVRHLIKSFDIYLMYDASIPRPAKRWLEGRLAALAESGELAAIVNRYR